MVGWAARLDEDTNHLGIMYYICMTEPGTDASKTPESSNSSYGFRPL